MSIPAFVMRGVLSCHECFFRPIKDDGPIRVSEVAEIEGNANEKDRGHLGLLLSYLFDL